MNHFRRKLPRHSNNSALQNYYIIGLIDFIHMHIQDLFTRQLRKISWGGVSRPFIFHINVSLDTQKKAIELYRTSWKILFISRSFPIYCMPI